MIEIINGECCVEQGEILGDRPFKTIYDKSFVAKYTKKDIIDKLHEMYKKLDCYMGKNGFLCNRCNIRLLRYSIWDKTTYPSGEDYALFKCPRCDEIYIGCMNKETKDWVIDHIKTIDNLVDIVV